MKASSVDARHSREPGRGFADARLGDASVSAGHLDVTAGDLLDYVSLALHPLALPLGLVARLVLGHLLHRITLTLKY